MRCPVCPEAQLVMTDRSGIEIDYCPQCRGVWLDRGELDKIIDRAAAAMPQAETPRQPMPPVAPAPMPQQQPQQQYPNQYPPQQQPGGILKEALGALRRDDDDDYKYRDRDRYHGHDDYRKKKKRGGMLGELFDFD